MFFCLTHSAAVGGRGTWCKKSRKGLKYRCACTKPKAKNAVGGRGTWCKKSRKGLKYRCACTKPKAKNAVGGPGHWCKKSRKGLKYRCACTKFTAKNAGDGRGWSLSRTRMGKEKDLLSNSPFGSKSFCFVFSCPVSTTPVSGLRNPVRRN